jgi:hypothetical protein
MGLLYGGQDYDQNFHYVGFDYISLEKDLKSLGFSHVGTWDNSIYAIDDYSKAYIPHKDKNGMLMSLNIEAIK